MRVRIDRNLCIGVGTCVANAPTVFEFDREELPVVLDEHGHTVPEHAVWATAKDCPTAAIILEDDQGSILYP